MWNIYRTTPKPIPDIHKRKAYLVGGGIASISAAVFLIQDARMPGENIFILEKTGALGGSLDGAGDPQRGYITRGGRMFEPMYEATWDLFARIPSLDNLGMTLLDEVVAFNREYVGSSKCRLVGTPGKKLDFSRYGLSLRHLSQMTELMLTPEEELSYITIQQWFDSSFFDTNFWYFWATMFAFQPWHSVAEMRRYMIRFIHHVPGLKRIEGILRTPYNQYDSVILPIRKWLEAHGVNFVLGTKVIDVEISQVEGGRRFISALLVERGGKPERIDVGRNDLVFITNGSIVKNSTYGDLDTPAPLNRSEGDVWRLWKNIVKKDPSLGNPDVFASDIDKTKWESFTVTFRGRKFIDMLERFTGNRTGTGGLVTFRDSSWLTSIVAFRQPHFRNQPEDVTVIWGYGLFVDKPGDYVRKPMAEATGREMLEEVLYHLGWLDSKDEIMAEVVNVIPAMMPYITSQFMPRAVGDRPPIVPENYDNLAFLGQFAELENECVFTVEYSVKSAMVAVYSMLPLGKVPPETYKGQYDIRVLMRAAESLMDPELKDRLKGYIMKFLSM